jgi:hypothetical protein
MSSERIRNSSDIVTLNVGGKHFTTCISTLTRYSTYFEAMFSQNWAGSTTSDDDDDNNNSDNDDGNNHGSDKNNASPTIFIDKDPIPFAYILNYMREGHIDLPKSTSASTGTGIGNNGDYEYEYTLAKNIIIQAQFFGLDDFISYIKIKSVQNCGKDIFSIDIHTNNCITDEENNNNDEEEDELGGCTSINVEEREEQKRLQQQQQQQEYENRLIDAFDTKYDSIMDAFDDGCLPYSYFEQYYDQVSIQVGNQKFTLNKTKLKEKSIVMKQTIDQNSGDSSSSTATTTTFYFHSSKRLYFIDQDPEAFQYLVHYIRCSQLVLPRNDPFVFRRILCCATDLQMNDFMILVKARTMMYIECHEAPMGLDELIPRVSPCAIYNGVTIEHCRYANNFDRRFSNIDAAFTQGILPSGFFDDF